MSSLSALIIGYLHARHCSQENHLTCSMSLKAWPFEDTALFYSAQQGCKQCKPTYGPIVLRLIVAHAKVHYH